MDLGPGGRADRVGGGTLCVEPGRGQWIGLEGNRDRWDNRCVLSPPPGWPAEGPSREADPSATAHHRAPPAARPERVRVVAVTLLISSADARPVQPC